MALKEYYDIKVPMTINGNLNITFADPDESGIDDYHDFTKYKGLNDLKIAAFAVFEVFFTFELADPEMEDSVEKSKAMSFEQIILMKKYYAPMIKRDCIGLTVATDYEGQIYWEGEGKLKEDVRKILSKVVSTSVGHKTGFMKRVTKASKRKAQLSSKFKLGEFKKKEEAKEAKGSDKSTEGVEKPKDAHMT